MPVVFFAPRSQAVFLLLLATSLLFSVGTGCLDNADDIRPTASQPMSSVDCMSGKLFDVRTGRCVQPTSTEDAKGLATREELVRLRNLGTGSILVELAFTTAATRSEFDALIQTTKPVLVEKIGYYFDVKGEEGIVVSADTESIPPTPTALRVQSESSIAARYDSFANARLKALAPAFSSAFSDGTERYSVVRLKAKPADLLLAWEQAPNIAYIAVQEHIQ